MTRTSGAWLVALACLLVASGIARGQERPSRYAEFRADAILGNGATGQAGVGAVIPFGVYVRLGIDGAAGATWRDGEARASGRVDAIARFLLDPFREAPIGFSLGGGVSVPYVRGDQHVRPYLATVIDIEGRVRGPITPAVQIGLGGGTRIGVVLRGSPARWR